MSIEAMKMALEALEFNDYMRGSRPHASKAITALRRAIEQAEQQEPVAFECPRCGHCCKVDGQEPVAWMYVNKDGECEQIEFGPVPSDPGVTPLYTAPVDAVNTSQERVDETAERKHMTDLASVGEVGVWGEREWVGLTDEEIVSVANTVDGFGVIKQRDMNFARAIEAAHGIGEKA
jgi:transcription elongation factor Elf1